MNARGSAGRQALGLLGWVALTAVAAALGAWASLGAPAFYAQLVRPPWAPPAGWFGPVWSVLYLAMAWAVWLVWREPASAARSRAIGLFVVQLAANALWSWLFFAWHLGAAAFADVLLLFVLIVATVAAFARVRQFAALLLLPYLAWVGFASALTGAVWRANPALLG